MHQRRSGMTVLAAWSVLAVCGLGSGHAMPSCTGKYSATLLAPLAQPTIVALDLADSSDVSASLGRAFTSGMQESGVTVSGPATVSLRLTYQVLGQGGGGGGNGGGQTQWSNA